MFCLRTQFLASPDTVPHDSWSWQVLAVYTIIRATFSSGKYKINIFLLKNLTLSLKLAFFRDKGRMMLSSWLGLCFVSPVRFCLYWAGSRWYSCVLNAQRWSKSDCKLSLSSTINNRLKEQGSCLAGKTSVVFQLSYASQVWNIGSEFLNPGNYRPFGLIQIISHNTSPLGWAVYIYIYIYICRITGISWESGFHELKKHESKMRLLKTRSHTPERQDYEADKVRQKRKK